MSPFSSSTTGMTPEVIRDSKVGKASFLILALDSLGGWTPGTGARQLAQRTVTAESSSMTIEVESMASSTAASAMFDLCFNLTGRRSLTRVTLLSLRSLWVPL